MCFGLELRGQYQWINGLGYRVWILLLVEIEGLCSLHIWFVDESRIISSKFLFFGRWAQQSLQLAGSVIRLDWPVPAMEQPGPCLRRHMKLVAIAIIYEGIPVGVDELLGPFTNRQPLALGTLMLFSIMIVELAILSLQLQAAPPAKLVGHIALQQGQCPVDLRQLRWSLFFCSRHRRVWLVSLCSRLFFIV